MDINNDIGGGASRTTDPASGSSSATDVSLREYVTEMIDSRFSYFSNWIENNNQRSKVVIIGIAAFGVFAWAEVQRRLELLNHENARLLAQQERTVSSDTYAANEAQRKSEASDLSEWRKEVDKDRTQAVTREEFQRDTRTEHRNMLNSGATVALVGFALVGTVIALLTYIAIHPS